MITAADTLSGLTERIAAPPLAQAWGPRFRLGLALAGALTLVFITDISYLFYKGVGIWGLNEPVAWGFALTCFVWWVGIGHAGTFISAFLLLLRQGWRAPVNRFSEAMTIFALAMAGLMPILHLGRPWFFYWLIPYPSVMNVWPQWRSPLVWDIFAISSYILVSLMFWYTGLLPDFATLRDRAESRWRRWGYGLLSLGWRGDARHWHAMDSAYLLMAGLAAPLVISVHSVVSLDFSFGLLPGWHSTLFPPYFVIGALFSGFAMALVLAVPVRAALRLDSIITRDHLAKMGSLMLVTGTILGYCYAAEAFFAWRGQDPFEMAVMRDRYTGLYAPLSWTMVACNIAAPQSLWLRRVRQSPVALFTLGLIALIGMWLERFIIIVQSLSHDFLPSSWRPFYPTIWDLGLLFGSIGTFVLLFMLFLRFVPVVSIHEVKKNFLEHGHA